MVLLETPSYAPSRYGGVEHWIPHRHRIHQDLEPTRIPKRSPKVFQVLKSIAWHYWPPKILGVNIREEQVVYKRATNAITSGRMTEDRAIPAIGWGKIPSINLTLLPNSKEWIKCGNLSTRMLKGRRLVSKNHNNLLFGSACRFRRTVGCVWFDIHDYRDMNIHGVSRSRSCRNSA